MTIGEKEKNTKNRDTKGYRASDVNLKQRAYEKGKVRYNRVELAPCGIHAFSSKPSQVALFTALMRQRTTHETFLCPAHIVRHKMMRSAAERPM